MFMGLFTITNDNCNTGLSKAYSDIRKRCAMKRVFGYYELPGAAIRYGGEKLWPQFPHVYFANMNPTEGMGAFKRIYGPLLASPVQPSGDAIVAAQEMLRKAWRGDEHSLHEVIEGSDSVWESPSEIQRISSAGEPINIIFSGYSRLEDPPRFETKINAQGMTIHAKDVWSFMRLAFMCDYTTEKTKVCANPDCETPFFLQSRKGQLFCSHYCASGTNVRRWRSKQEQTKPAKVHESIRMRKSTNKTRRSR
jgi:hypothetical protein